MKKIIVLATTLAMLFSFSLTAWAEESTPPVLDSAISALEHAQLDLSDILEQALLQSEFNNKRVEALENMPDLDVEVIEALLAYLEENEEKLGMLIAELVTGKELPANDSFLESIADDVDERGWRLSEIAADETFPEGARAGAERALDNMQEAAQKADWALDREENGPPEWAMQRDRDEGASNHSPVSSPPTEGQVPPVAPPAGEPPVNGDDPSADAPPVPAPPVEVPPVDAPPVAEESPVEDAPPVEAPSPAPEPPVGAPRGR